MNEDEGKDIIRTETPPSHPFARGLDASANAGAVSIESERAIAEAQGKLVIAKRFPRDESAAFAKIVSACKRITLAESATYAFPRGDSVVTGPSIRLAEELARCWGNMSYGTRELSRRPGVSEMEAFAWDEESNVRSVQQFTVRHIRETKSGSYPLKDERDIYEATANNAARRLRARILAILPPDIIEDALEECRRTVSAHSAKDLAQRITKMVETFSRYGVTVEMLEKRLKHPVAETTADEIADLAAIHTSIRDRQRDAGEWFPVERAADDASETAPDGPQRPAVLGAVAATGKKRAARGEADDDAAPASKGSI